MPANLSSKIKTWAIILGIITTLFTYVQGYGVLNYRVDKSEKSIETLRMKIETDHDLLIKIYQDVQYIKERGVK